MLEFDCVRLQGEEILIVVTISDRMDILKFVILCTLEGGEQTKELSSLYIRNEVNLHNTRSDKRKRIERVVA